MISLTSVIVDILNENLSEKLLNDSIKFNWKNNRYYWVDDKKGMNIDTSMTTRGEDDKVKYKYTEFLLPRSNVMSYNLFEISNFFVTQALKHNKVTRNLTDREKAKYGVNKMTFDLMPDKSIEDFKDFTARYIVKILMSKGFDIDAVLTPQSSSNFNPDMISKIAYFYQKATNKKILVVPNAFVKSPKDIKVDTENIQANVSQEVVKYFKPDAPAREVEMHVKAKITDLYKEIKIWKLEDDIQPIMIKLYDIWKTLEVTKEKRMWEKNRQKVLQEISMEIRYILGDIEKVFGKDFYETKYFVKGNFHPEAVATPWQIKHLSNGIRKSIYNIFKLTSQFDKEYSYQKDNTEVKGVSKLIDRLARNNKTILIFDDNLSSGATLDDASYTLIKHGINKDDIVVITLGKVPESSYSLADLRRASNISSNK